MSKPEETPVREILAAHETIAVFDGKSERPCLKQTTKECPNKCTHHGFYYAWTIEKYTKYGQPNPQGDPQVQKFSLRVNDIPDDIKAKIIKLNKGDKVVLHWRHDNVTKGATKYQERMITKLEKV
mmetsp:Transcript_11743/g.20170  ORF Transcript_11743/g.20170 Transcript_11743/m.20170 type:complete len:125 (+) Transcript_11743:235-609(+)